MKYLASFTTLCLLVLTLFGSHPAHSVVPNVERTPPSRYQNAIAFDKDNIYSEESKRLEKISPDYKLAGKFYNLKNWSQAIYYYNRAISAHPNSAAIYIERGFSYGNMRHYQAALADVNMALTIRPLFASGLYLRGVYHLRLDDKTAAAADFIQAMSLFKKDGDTAMYKTSAEFLKLCYQ